MPFDEAADYRFNPFDLTKVWPHGDYPPIEVGRMVARPQPGELLRRGRAGRLLAGQPRARHRPVARTRCCIGRLFSYPDTHRTGSAPTTSSCRSTRRGAPSTRYNKDGAMSYEHAGDQRSTRRTRRAARRRRGRATAPTRLARRAASMGRYANAKHAEDDDFGPAGHARSARSCRRRSRPPRHEHRRPRERRRRAARDEAAHRPVLDEHRSGRRRGGRPRPGRRGARAGRDRLALTSPGGQRIRSRDASCDACAEDLIR